MDVSVFLAGRLKFKGKIAVISIAISFLVMIVAVAVSSGFRHEIRNSLSALAGDIRIVPPDMNVLDVSNPVESTPSYLSRLTQMEEIREIVPVVYRAGLVKSGEDIHGVVFKGLPGGVERADSLALAVSIPRRLAEMASLEVGEAMTTYFVEDKVKVRKFTVAGIHDALVETDNNMVVYADMADLQRLAGWSSGQVSALEILLEEDFRDEAAIRMMTQEVGAYVNAYSSDSEAPVIAVSSLSMYPQLFDWLDLIDFNVFFILLLMTAVAGFNMISGLLIMLFEHISTIGILKALGMTDKAISKIFLTSSGTLVLKGMAVGNLIAILFCIIQDKTHFLTLDPRNYFVSFVPVHADLVMILSADIIAFIAIMLLLLIPCRFISKVDPAHTIRVK